MRKQELRDKIENLKKENEKLHININELKNIIDTDAVNEGKKEFDEIVAAGGDRYMSYKIDAGSVSLKNCMTNYKPEIVVEYLNRKVDRGKFAVVEKNNEKI